MNFPGIKPRDAGETAKERGFPRAIRPQQRDDLAWLDGHRDTVKRAGTAILFQYFAEFNGHK